MWDVCADVSSHETNQNPPAYSGDRKLRIKCDICENFGNKWSPTSFLRARGARKNNRLSRSALFRSRVCKSVCHTYLHRNVFILTVNLWYTHHLFLLKLLFSAALSIDQIACSRNLFMYVRMRYHWRCFMAWRWNTVKIKHLKQSLLNWTMYARASVLFFRKK